MIDRRLIWGYGLISLPALCATAFAVLACYRLRPIYEERERTAITAHYREIAEELRDDPTRGTVDRMPDDHGRIRSMKPGSWGYVERADETIVWYRLFERTQVVQVPRLSSLSFAALLFPTLSVSLVLFWLVTIAGCAMLRKSVKDRDDFIAASAHDLKTPLTSLMRFIGTNDRKAARVAERMMYLVSNLTDFLRLGGHSLSPLLESVDPQTAFRDAYAMFDDEFRWVSGGSDVEFSCETAAFVSADPRILNRVLVNLVSNELKYAAPCGKVSVRIEDAGANVRFVFADEGPGLSAHDRRRVFRRYFRARDVLKSGKGGFGLGLCLARDFARTMGGDLTVHANPPKGTRFVLTLRRV